MKSARRSFDAAPNHKFLGFVQVAFSQSELLLVLLIAVHTSRSSQRSLFLVAVLAALALFATACGTSTDGTSSGVATLEDVAVADAIDDDGDATLAADEAALQFSQCMRDEGLDFGDIGVDAEGNPNVIEAFQAAGIEPRSAEFQEAIQNCGDSLEGVGFGGGQRPGLDGNVEVQDALLDFSECLRDEGIEVGDLELGGGPGGEQEQNADGERPEPGEGEREGGFGDRSTRIANALDLDPDDPDTAAALDMCNPVLDTAFANFGPGAPANG